MTCYMLDTNTVTYLIRGNPQALQRLQAVPMSALCVSSVTAGELLFGLAKRPEATRLGLAVHEFLQCVDILPWDRSVAERYGTIQAELEARGITVAPVDLLIASHAIAVGAVLVSNDKAMRRVRGLRLENWTA